MFQVVVKGVVKDKDVLRVTEQQVLYNRLAVVLFIQVYVVYVHQSVQIVVVLLCFVVVVVIIHLLFYFIYFYI